MSIRVALGQAHARADGAGELAAAEAGVGLVLVNCLHGLSQLVRGSWLSQFFHNHFAKMPKFINVSDQDVSDIAKEGGNKEVTVRRRNQAMNHLREFGLCKDTPVDANDLIDMAKNDDTAPLEALLEHFFAAFRVGENEELPKKNTVDMYR